MSSEVQLVPGALIETPCVGLAACSDALFSGLPEEARLDTLFRDATIVRQIMTGLNDAASEEK